MIPTMVGILLINFAVLRLQGVSLVEELQLAQSDAGAGTARADARQGGGSTNLENYLDRFRRAGNDLPAVVNLRGFTDRVSIEARLHAASPSAPGKESDKSRAEKELWLYGRFAVLPLAAILADDACADLHGPASLAFSLCAYTSVSPREAQELPTELLNRIRDDNQFLRANRIDYRRDAGRGFVTSDKAAGDKRARLLAFIQDPRNRARYEVTTGDRWSSILGETGFTDVMGKLFTGQLWSETKKAYVFTLIGQRWQVTAWLVVLSIILSWGISIPLGIRSARRIGTVEDSITTNVLFLLWSLPVIFIGTVMLHHLCTESSGRPAPFPNAGLWTPGSETWPWWQRLTDWAWHGFLPLICITYASFTVLSRYMRGSLLDQVTADYTRTARAKGCSDDTVIYRHALPNSMITMITLGSGLLAELFTGFTFVENIFSIQGLGLLLVDAARQSDAPLVMGTTVISVGLLLVGILIADILYGVVDPRIRSRYG